MPARSIHCDGVADRMRFEAAILGLTFSFLESLLVPPAGANPRVSESLTYQYSLVIWLALFAAMARHLQSGWPAMKRYNAVEVTPTAVDQFPHQLLDRTGHSRLTGPDMWT